MKTISYGEKYAPHKTSRTALCDRTDRGRTNMPARGPGTGQRPARDDEVYFIQVDGIRRPAGLFLACDPFSLPERVRTKINQYARGFLRRFGMGL